jgi:uncharacterized protein DUF3363
LGHRRSLQHRPSTYPHRHRGKDETGRDLVIAREYLTHGLRERASEIVSLDLGPRTDREIEERLSHEVGQERFTSLDRTLLRAAEDDGRLELRALSSPSAGERSQFQQSLRMGRLRTLERLCLAQEEGPGVWRLLPEIEPTLRRLGERGDAIKALHREMAREGHTRNAGDYAIYDPADATAPKRLVGRLVTRGLSDELEDRHYLVVDGIDGRTHWVDVGRGDTIEAMPDGALVEISPRSAGVRSADRTVTEIAEANQGRYSVDLHLRHDANASYEFAEAHVRRLEAMRRAGAGVERQPGWDVADFGRSPRPRGSLRAAPRGASFRETIAARDGTPHAGYAEWVKLGHLDGITALPLWRPRLSGISRDRFGIVSEVPNSEVRASTCFASARTSSVRLTPLAPLIRRIFVAIAPIKHVSRYELN